MRTLKIFLASSSELQKDREQFEILLARLNINSIKKAIFFELVIWENFLDVMSADRLQSNYNKAIRNCDIFVMLFFTKVGNFTKEEFETAFGTYKENGRPKVFTYFRNSTVHIGELAESDMMSLFAFKQRLSELGHFYSTYSNIDELKFKFVQQLEKLEEGGLLVNYLIDPELNDFLDREQRFCRANNCYIYAANLIRVFLESPLSVTHISFEQARKGYASLLYVRLSNLIQEEFISARKAKPFIEEDWLKRQDFIHAAKHANRENSSTITERYLLQGIVDLNGSTIQMIRQDLGEQGWTIFLNSVRSIAQNPTPLWSD